MKYMMFNLEYFYIIIVFLIALFLGILIYFISYKLILKNFDVEKLSIYECGFKPFGTTRKEFDVKFYLVALLFVIFDIEIVFLFPWVLVLGSLDFIAILYMSIFVYILLIIYVYEWFLGALD